MTRLRDVARVTLGADAYTLRSLLNGEAAPALQIIQSPGANAIDVSNAIRGKMDELQQNFPQDIEYRIAYDPTVFVRASLQSVAITLLEALVLVVLVVVMFLQTAGVHYSSGGGSRFAGRHLCLDAPVWLFAEYAFAVWFGPVDRYRCR